MLDAHSSPTAPDERDGSGTARPAPPLSLAPVRLRATSRWPVLAVSLTVHALAVAVLLLLPLFLPEDSLDRPEVDYVRVLIYDPPPPPPPPPPKGAPDGGRRAARPRVDPEPRSTPVPSESRLEAPVEVLAAERIGLGDERPGSPTGSESGVPEGMEGGVEGGVVGGVPGGVLGGVIGGTGTGPVPVQDYDRPPRLLRPIKPKYPPEAFVKKIQGVVLVEFLIDSTGRVVRARVVQSVPLLDAAALEAVRDWIFSPAIKHGSPVATIARAPVSFVIY
jgi:periplasmic protein TonB